MFDDRNKSESLYHLALIKLRKVFPGSEKGNNDLKRWLETYGSLQEAFNQITGQASLESTLEKNLSQAQRKLECFDFETVTIQDPRFPQHLKGVKGATPILYASGDLSLWHKKSIAIVGTRELHNSEDREDGEKIVQNVLGKEYVVVSGLAEGCDELAHRYAVSHKGKTIAVLGTPLDKHYPSRNKDLQDTIRKEHLLVSQYPIGMSNHRAYFALRNKTTVGIATKGIVVIIADDKSGTQHAIKECLAQNKSLYVLKNNLNRGFEWIEKLKGKYTVLNPNKEA
ncbi:DNA-processing protein DprA [Candidatus Pacearchaeota archaeon]|nr:DNA-processing protein DprA [Candidatus Pacearchaeota archaeon]